MTSDVGILVAIEGIDGAGKNTLVSALESALDARGLSSARRAFPRYGTHHADLAAGALRGRLGPVSGSPEAMALLFALDRQAATPDLLAAKGEVDVLLCDRYVASNAAYSAARLGERSFSDVIGWIEAMEHEEMGVPRADGYILLPTPVTEARRRADARAADDASRELDAYETDARLQVDTAAAYERLAQTEWTAPWWRAELGVPPEDAAAMLADRIAALA